MTRISVDKYFIIGFQDWKLSRIIEFKSYKWLQYINAKKNESPFFDAICSFATQIDDPQSYPTLKFLFGTQSLCQLLIYLKFNANPAGYTSFFLLFKKNFHTRSHQDTLIYHSMKARCLAMTSQLHVKTIQQILWYLTTVKMLKIIDTVINKSEKHSWDII